MGLPVQTAMCKLCSTGQFSCYIGENENWLSRPTHREKRARVCRDNCAVAWVNLGTAHLCNLARNPQCGFHTLHLALAHHSPSHSFTNAVFILHISCVLLCILLFMYSASKHHRAHRAYLAWLQIRYWDVRKLEHCALLQLEARSSPKRAFCQSVHQCFSLLAVGRI